MAAEATNVSKKQPTAALQKLVDELNEKMPYDQECFVCDGCTAIKLESPTYMETSKWGYERPFCDDCILHCHDCGEDYVYETAHQHEECKPNDSDKEDDDGDNEDAELEQPVNDPNKDS